MVCVLSWFCVVICVLSSLAIILLRKEWRVGFLYLNCSLGFTCFSVFVSVLSSLSKCVMTFSEICDWYIFKSYTLAV